jgi:antagonist of KipI
VSIEVLRPGPLSTLQDLGRHGYQRFGVVVGGAMDEDAHRLANMLVGNPADEATLEFTLQGPSLDFHDETLVAVCGADMGARVDDRLLPMDRPVLLKAGTRVDFGSCRSGCRTYLAIGGGYDVPLLMGSRSTFVRGGFGGLEGRALRKGDWIRLRKPTRPWLPGLESRLRDVDGPFVATRWAARGLGWTARPDLATIRVVPGRHWDRFPRAAITRFTRSEYRASVNSDRMGYRLEGATLEPRRRVEAISEAIAFGTIQVPHDGLPIVLMADRQTTGGYPKIAEVISVDLPAMAQLRPGDRLCFQAVTIEQAQQLYFARMQDRAAVLHAIEQHQGE